MAAVMVESSPAIDNVFSLIFVSRLQPIHYGHPVPEIEVIVRVQ